MSLRFNLFPAREIVLLVLAPPRTGLKRVLSHTTQDRSQKRVLLHTTQDWSQKRVLHTPRKTGLKRESYRTPCKTGLKGLTAHHTRLVSKKSYHTPCKTGLKRESSVLHITQDWSQKRVFSIAYRARLVSKESLIAHHARLVSKESLR